MDSTTTINQGWSEMGKAVGREMQACMQSINVRVDGKGPGTEYSTTTGWEGMGWKGKGCDGM